MKIDFLCPCPCDLCKNNEPKKIIKWKHTPSCYLGEWIDDEGYVTCKNDAFRFFVLDCTFDCKNEVNCSSIFIKNHYIFSDYLIVLSSLSTIKGIKEDFLLDILKRIKQRARKIGLIK